MEQTTWKKRLFFVEQGSKKRAERLFAFSELHLGPEIARWAVKKDGVVARMLVRDGFQAVEKKKKVVDELLRLGCELHLGDASDVNSLVLAFTGADVVISSLGILFDSDSSYSTITDFKFKPSTLTLYP